NMLSINDTENDPFEFEGIKKIMTRLGMKYIKKDKFGDLMYKWRDRKTGWKYIKKPKKFNTMSQDIGFINDYNYIKRYDVAERIIEANNLIIENGGRMKNNI